MIDFFLTRKRSPAMTSTLGTWIPHLGGWPSTIGSLPPTFYFPPSTYSNDALPLGKYWGSRTFLHSSAGFCRPLLQSPSKNAQSNYFQRTPGSIPGLQSCFFISFSNLFDHSYGQSRRCEPSSIPCGRLGSHTPKLLSHERYK